MRDERFHQAGLKTESHMVNGLKAGSVSAWREVMSAHGTALVGYAAKLVGDIATAEEVVQDCWLNIYRSINRFDGRCSLKSWLYKAVHNRAIDEIRRRKNCVNMAPDTFEDVMEETGRRREENPEWDGLAAQKADQKRSIFVVQSNMTRLSDGHREIIRMAAFEGLGSQDICRKLNITPGNYRIRIHRARSALREAVGPTLAFG